MYLTDEQLAREIEAARRELERMAREKKQLLKNLEVLEGELRRRAR